MAEHLDTLADRLGKDHADYPRAAFLHSKDKRLIVFFNGGGDTELEQFQLQIITMPFRLVGKGKSADGRTLAVAFEPTIGEPHVRRDLAELITQLLQMQRPARGIAADASITDAEIEEWRRISLVQDREDLRNMKEDGGSGSAYYIPKQ
jgi:hypothetical protein